jgi:hypothetical protein
MPPFLQFGQDVLGGGNGLGVLPVSQAVPRPPIAIAQGVQHPPDRRRADLPPVTPQQVGQISHRPNGDRIAGVQRGTHQCGLQQGAGVSPEGRWTAGPWPIRQSLAAFVQEPTAPDADPLGAAPHRLRRLLDTPATSERQQRIRPVSDAWIVIRAGQSPQCLGVSGKIEHEAILLRGRQDFVPQDFCRSA